MELFVLSEKLTRELSALDRNKDGRITLEELYEYVRWSKRVDYQRSHSKYSLTFSLDFFHSFQFFSHLICVLFRDRTMSSLLEYLRVVANAKIIKKWPPPILIPTISLLVIIIHFTTPWYPQVSISLRFDRQSSKRFLNLTAKYLWLSVITGTRPGGI